MRDMTFREKLEYLESVPAENMHEVSERVVSGYVEEDERRIKCRIDIRERLKAIMAEQKITAASIARRLGISSQHFHLFITNEKPLKLELIEELLWLMEGGNLMTDAEMPNYYEMKTNRRKY